MPTISRFLGIIITMYFDEHNQPHFHAKYNEHKAVFFNKRLNGRVREFTCKSRIVGERMG